MSPISALFVFEPAEID